MNITNYESIALKTILEGCSDLDPATSTADEYYNCFCDADTLSIAKDCGITENQAKGVLSSLVKKKLVHQHGEDYGYMINLTAKGLDLVSGK